MHKNFLRRRKQKRGSMTTTKNAVFNLRVSDAERAEMDRVAELRGVTVSELLRQVVALYHEREILMRAAEARLAERFSARDLETIARAGVAQKINGRGARLVGEHIVGDVVELHGSPALVARMSALSRAELGALELWAGDQKRYAREEGGS